MKTMTYDPVIQNKETKLTVLTLILVISLYAASFPKGTTCNRPGSAGPFPPLPPARPNAEPEVTPAICACFLRSPGRFSDLEDGVSCLHSSTGTLWRLRGPAASRGQGWISARSLSAWVPGHSCEPQLPALGKHCKYLMRTKDERA